MMLDHCVTLGPIAIQYKTHGTSQATFFSIGRDDEINSLEVSWLIEVVRGGYNKVYHRASLHKSKALFIPIISKEKFLDNLRIKQKDCFQFFLFHRDS